MEYKTVTLISVLIMSLMLAQIHAKPEVCCYSSMDRQLYNVCMEKMAPNPAYCASMIDCLIPWGSECPRGYSNDILGNSGDIVNEYCKLGCASFMCGALITLHNSDATKMKGVVGKCTKACSTLCTNGSKTARALETA